MQLSIYFHLWKLGGGRDDGAQDFVDAPAGWGRLSKQLSLSDKTIKSNMLQLVQKRVIELVKEEDRYTNLPRIYRVWSMKSVLERWRSAGMTYVKANSGVQFLTPEEVDLYRAQGRLPVERTPRVGATTGVRLTRYPPDAASIAPREAAYIPPGERVSTHPRVKITPPSLVVKGVEVQDLNNPSSSASNEDRAIIAAELAKYIDHIGTTDDAYIDRLIDRCRQRAPVAPAGMIAWVISTKVRKALKGSVEDRAAYLLTSVEGMFSGVSYDIARKEWDARESERIRREAVDAQQRERTRLENLAQAQEILEHPEKWQDDRDFWVKWATETLAAAGDGK